MRKWVISIMILILLTGCTNQNQAVKESLTESSSAKLKMSVREESQITKIEESATAKKLQSLLKKNSAQEWKKKERIIYTTEAIQLYEEPSTDSETMAIVSPGDALKQIAIMNDWIKVSYCEEEYYIQKQYITSKKPQNAFPVSHAEAIHTLTTEQITELKNLNADLKGFGSGNDRDGDNRPLLPVSLQDHYREKDYKVTFIGDNTNYIFLTFDMGWEYSNDGIRNTEKLLDLLEEKNVKAAFFVTHEYADKNKDLVKRMIEEGHVVGNHGYSHPDAGIPSLSLEKQIEDTINMQNYIKDTFNYDMYMYRFSSSCYSDRSLSMVDKMGYHVSFWSAESVDWYVDNQPDPTQLIQEYTKELHPGAVYMMHAVSNSNIAIMEQLIDQAREQGYEFGYYSR